MTLTNILSQHDTISKGILGTDKNTIHSYGSIYEQLLEPYRESASWVLEIGIGYGESLRVWREYFTKAHIIGLDNLQRNMFSEDRITTIYGDQSNPKNLALSAGSTGIKYDVIIDDGSHNIEHQIMSLFWLWPLLTANGVYFIEDVQDPSVLLGFNAFGEAQIHDLRGVKGRHDDIMVALYKRNMNIFAILANSNCGT